MPNPPRTAYRRALLIIAGLILGLGLGHLMKTTGLSRYPVGLVLLCAMLAAPLAVIAHELGHVCAGLLVGFEPVFAMIGPLRWCRMPSGWKFDYGKLGFFGGAAASVPRTEQHLRARLLWYISGGVLGNILTAALVLLSPGVFSTAFASISALFILIALWPRTAAGVHTDGFRIVQMLRGGPSAERWEASILLTAIDYRGIRPRDWPADIVRKASALTDPDPDTNGACLLAYHWALDCGDTTAAEVWLNRALDNDAAIPVFARSVYQIEAAFLAALLYRDVALATDHLAAAGTRGLFRQAALYRAKAMTALAAGDPDEARHLAAEGLRLAADDWDPGLLEFDIDWLRRVAAGDFELTARHSA